MEEKDVIDAEFTVVGERAPWWTRIRINWWPIIVAAALGLPKLIQSLTAQ